MAYFIMNRIYEDEDWIVEKGANGYFSVSYFVDGHYYNEIILRVKDDEIEVVRRD